MTWLLSLVILCCQPPCGTTKWFSRSGRKEKCQSFTSCSGLTVTLNLGTNSSPLSSQFPRAHPALQLHAYNVGGLCSESHLRAFLSGIQTVLQSHCSLLVCCKSNVTMAEYWDWSILCLCFTLGTYRILPGKMNLSEVQYHTHTLSLSLTLRDAQPVLLRHTWTLELGLVAL